MESVVTVEIEEDQMEDLMEDLMAGLLQVAGQTAEQAQAEDGWMTKDVLTSAAMHQVVTAEAKVDQSEAGTEVSQWEIDQTNDILYFALLNHSYL